MTARKPPKLLIKQCPHCLAELTWDSDKWAYICTNTSCPTEIYHDRLGKDEPQTKQDTGNKYVSRSMVDGAVAPGGSSSGKKYGGKERMKKPTVHQIYDKLCDR